MYPIDESKRVGRSLIVLLAALLLVYVIFFDVHGDNLRINPSTLSKADNPLGSELTGEDIDRIVYIDTTNQVSNNQNSDSIYFPSNFEKNPNVAITAPDSTLVQAQNIQKAPLIVEPTPQVDVSDPANAVPDIINDAEGRRFYSTDFLF